MTRIRLTCLFAFLLAAQTWAADEPSSVAEAMRGLASENTDRCLACIRFLGQHYREAKGAMLAALDCDHGRFAIGLTGAFARVGDPAIPDLLRLLPKANKREKVNIAHAFAQMGAKAKTAVTGLHSQLKSEEFEVREAVLKALGEIRDKRSLRLISKSLEDKHSRVRSAAMDALASFGADAGPVTAEVVLAVKSGNGGFSGSLCLGRIGRSCIAAIDKEVMDSKNPVQVRSDFIAAISAMANYGPKADAVSALPVLRKIIEGNNSELREHALSAVQVVCNANSSIDADKELGWLFRSKRIESLSASDKVSVADIAAMFKRHRKLAVALLNDALRSSDPRVVRYAVAACLSLEEDRPAVAAGLERAMRSQDSGVRWLAVRRVTGDPRYIVAAPRLLWIAISDENEHCCEDARRALAAVSDAVWKQYLVPTSLKNSLFRAYSVLLDGLGILAGRH